MENNDEMRAQLRAAERAEAAPYVDYPEDPRWAAPAFGGLALLLALTASLHDRPVFSSLLSMLVVLSVMGYVIWQRRRRGTQPSGKAPREISQVIWGFVAGAIVIGFALLSLGYSAPLWLALPVAFVVGTAGLLWFGRAYDRAAARVRERLT